MPSPRRPFVLRLVGLVFAVLLAAPACSRSRADCRVKTGTAPEAPSGAAPDAER